MAAAPTHNSPTVYLIRHGEKPSSGGDGLDAEGEKRAQCLRKVFGAKSKYNIKHIMAQKFKKGIGLNIAKQRNKRTIFLGVFFFFFGNTLFVDSFAPFFLLFVSNQPSLLVIVKKTIDGSRERPFLTSNPLAHDLGLKVDTSCARDDAKCVAKVVKNYKGPGNILICWEHGALTDIVKSLGDKKAPEYPDKE